jgi:tetratricopeptide (TPR) repeat protein
MSDFLSFVVTEYLRGRQTRIKAVTIAQFVYGRDQDFDSQSDPIVRVEAGRLRSRLGEYYADTGRNDPIEIEIPKGAYVPLISLRSDYASDPEPEELSGATGLRRSFNLRLSQIGAIGLGSATIGFLLALLYFSSHPQIRSILPHFTENVEAYSLFLHAREAARPPTIKTRVLVGMQLAREAQTIDPSFGGGYAMESFQLWQYVLFGHSKAPEADTQRALELAQKAIEIDPEFGWGYQSLSRVLQLKGDAKGAVAAAQHAVELSPNNAEQLGNFGLTLVVAGRSADAIAPLEKSMQLARENVRDPYLNYFSMAQFHNREFANAAATIEKNRARGGPMGPHMHAYLAAAYAMAGNDGHARAFAAMVRSNKSGFSMGRFIETLFLEKEDRDLLFSALEKAGLSRGDL